MGSSCSQGAYGLFGPNAFCRYKTLESSVTISLKERSCYKYWPKFLSSAVIGTDAYVVDVEVDIARGLPSFTTVGLPEGAVRESKERVKAAVTNSGYHFPSDRITENLAPADIKKEGSAFDFPMALGILAATGLLEKSHYIFGGAGPRWHDPPHKGCPVNGHRRQRHRCERYFPSRGKCERGSGG